MSHAARTLVLILLLVAGGPTAIGGPGRNADAPRPEARAVASRADVAAPADAPARLDRDRSAASDLLPADAPAPVGARAAASPHGPPRHTPYRPPFVSLVAGRGPPSIA
jgi:hypothetical protein